MKDNSKIVYVFLGAKEEPVDTDIHNGTSKCEPILSIKPVVNTMCYWDKILHPRRKGNLITDSVPIFSACIPTAIYCYCWKFILL